MSRWPTGPFTLRRTGCYGCVRRSSSDGACGVTGYPCVHYGMDLFASSREVVAPERGRVVAVADGSSAPWTGYGPGVIVIAGASGVFHLMGHLQWSSIRVRVGDELVEGQRLADFDPEIAHTHYEVRRQLTGPSKTNTIDPEAWLRGISVFGLVLIGVSAWALTRWIAGRTV